MDGVMGRQSSDRGWCKTMDSWDMWVKFAAAPVGRTRGHASLTLFNTASLGMYFFDVLYLPNYIYLLIDFFIGAYIIIYLLCVELIHYH